MGLQDCRMESLVRRGEMEGKCAGLEIARRTLADWINLGAFCSVVAVSVVCYVNINAVKGNLLEDIAIYECAKMGVLRVVLCQTKRVIISLYPLLNPIHSYEVSIKLLKAIVCREFCDISRDLCSP